MEKMVGFVKLYFPVFLLGTVFGKVFELSGFSESIVAVCALLTYGGVSLFVVVFAVYSFAAEMVSPEQYPEAADAGRHRAGRVLVHDGFAAGHAANDPEHHSDDVLQDDRLGRAVARRDRLGVSSWWD